MKKLKRVHQSAGVIYTKLSTFEAILVETILSLLLFIFLLQPPIYAQVATGVSLTLNWARPQASVYFTDVGGKVVNERVDGSYFSTPTYTYWPGSGLSYVVRAYDETGPVIKTGSTTATSDGRGEVSWDWSYAAVVFIDSAGNCLATGAECQTKSIGTSDPVHNNQTLTWTFGGLRPDTVYRKVVCVPNCGTGRIIYPFPQTEKTQPAPTPAPKAKLAPVATSCTRAGPGNIVKADFSCTPALGVTIDKQYLDFSVYNNFDPPS